MPRPGCGADVTAARSRPATAAVRSLSGETDAMREAGRRLGTAASGPGRARAHAAPRRVAVYALARHDAARGQHRGSGCCGIAAELAVPVARRPGSRRSASASAHAGARLLPALRGRIAGARGLLMSAARGPRGHESDCHARSRLCRSSRWPRNGAVVRDPAEAPPGTEIEARLALRSAASAGPWTVSAASAVRRGASCARECAAGAASACRAGSQTG